MDHDWYYINKATKYSKHSSDRRKSPRIRANWPLWCIRDDRLFIHGESVPSSAFLKLVSLLRMSFGVHTTLLDKTFSTKSLENPIMRMKIHCGLRLPLEVVVV